MSDAEISQMDIVWKFAIHDEYKNVLAGIDQFDNVHTYISVEELASHITALDAEGSALIYAIQLGLAIGEKNAAKEILTEWVTCEGFYDQQALIDKYGLTEKEINPR